MPNADAACYVCHFPIDMPEQNKLGDIFDCARCGIRNVALGYGRQLNRPERLAIYNDYDATFDGKRVGMVPAVEYGYQVKFRSLDARRARGEISAPDYERERYQLSVGLKRDLMHLDNAKRRALYKLKRDEAIIRERLGIVVPVTRRSGPR